MKNYYRYYLHYNHQLFCFSRYYFMRFPISQNGTELFVIKQPSMKFFGTFGKSPQGNNQKNRGNLKSIAQRLTVKIASQRLCVRILDVVRSRTVFVDRL